MKANIRKAVITIILIVSTNLNAFTQFCYTCGTNSGSNSTAFGNSSIASGEHSVALGYSSSSSMTGAMSFGWGANASNFYSTAIGLFSSASGSQSVSIGQHATATADQSYAFGKYVTSTASGAIAIGSGTSNSSQILVNNTPYSLMVGFLSNVPTLYVGPPEIPPNTGFVGISTSDPKQPLHVNGNSLVDGHMYLIGEYSNLVFSDELCSGTRGDFAIEYHEGGLNFWKPWKEGGINAGDNYLFLKDDGKVGINTNAPRTRLDVNGDMTVRGLATGAGLKMVVVNETGIFSSEDIVGGDNLGNHTATQNLNLNGYFLSGDSEDEGIYIDHDGNIGVNTAQPIASFDMVSQSDNSLMVRTTTANNSSLWAINSINGYGIGVEPDGTGYIYSSYPTKNKLIYFKNNKVGIGAPPKETHNLYVAGGITTEEVKVRIQSNWTDYVFKKDYALLSISDLEAFIDQNGHLPEVPSSEDVENNGVNLGEMNALLLKKIEELSLYVIDLKKEIDILKEKNNKSVNQR